jgi:hypothetical protein
VLKFLAVLFAAIAVALLALAIYGMTTHRLTDRQGWAVRAVALASFAACVILNSAAH